MITEFFTFRSKSKRTNEIDKVSFYERLKLNLKETEHSISEANGLIVGKRNRFSTNEVSDKFDLFRRIQYTVFIDLDEEKKIISYELNLKSQFLIIIFSLFTPFFLLYLLYGTLINVIVFSVIYLLASLIWYLFSIDIAKSIIDKVIKTSILPVRSEPSASETNK